MTEPLVELEPELEPIVEVTARALPNVGAVAVLTVALGMILAVDAICRAFFGTLTGSVGWIPYLGSVISSPIRKIEQKVVSFLSGIAADVEGALGHNIHVAARLLDKALYDLELLAANIVLLGALGVAAAFHYLIHPLERFVRGSIRKVEEEIHQIERELQRQGAHVTKVITHNVFPRIQGATVSVERVIKHELQPIRHTATEAERIAKRAEKKVEALNHRVSNKALLAAIGAAIGTTALDALKCTSLGNLFNNRGCSLWNDLEDILGLLADLAAFSAICEIVPWLTGAFEDIATPFVEALAAATKELCPEPKGWASLNVAHGPLPPAQTLGPLGQ